MSPKTVPERPPASQAPPSDEQAHDLVQLLRHWSDGDAAEQSETLEYLTVALDEDRPLSRRLFPR